MPKKSDSDEGSSKQPKSAVVQIQADHITISDGPFTVTVTPPPKVVLKGMYSSSALGGVFHIVRGYANLRDLAIISKPYGFDASTGEGYQRELIADHADDIKRYLEAAIGYKFLPEIILGARIGKNTNEIQLHKGFSEEEIQRIIDPEGFEGDKSATKPETLLGKEVEVVVDVNRVHKNSSYFRRIDGNHRLHHAENLEIDMNNPNKYVVPFCILLLGDPSNEFDDIAEAMVFHNINFKVMPVDSEHGLSVLISKQEDDELWREDVSLFGTKVFREALNSEPEILEIFGDIPYTRISKLVKFLKQRGLIAFENKETAKANLETSIRKAHDIFAWAKREGLKLCEYYEIIPAIFLVINAESEMSEQNNLIKKFSQWLESNNLWSNFPEQEFVLFDVFLSIERGLTLCENPITQYISLDRIAELRAVENVNFDTKKIIRLCEEINITYANKLYLSTGSLIRALIDHVPPIFSKSNFTEVANNHGGISFKALMRRLDGQSKEIANAILHEQIRNSESLPCDNQVDFRQEIDKLLEEVCRSL